VHIITVRGCLSIWQRVKEMASNRTTRPLSRGIELKQGHQTAQHIPSPVGEG